MTREIALTNVPTRPILKRKTIICFNGSGVKIPHGRATVNGAGGAIRH